MCCIFMWKQVIASTFWGCPATLFCSELDSTSGDFVEAWVSSLCPPICFLHPGSLLMVLFLPLNGKYCQGNYFCDLLCLQMPLLSALRLSDDWTEYTIPEENLSSLLWWWNFCLLQQLLWLKSLMSFCCLIIIRGRAKKLMKNEMKTWDKKIWNLCLNFW